MTNIAESYISLVICANAMTMWIYNANLKAEFRRIIQYFLYSRSLPISRVGVYLRVI